MHWLFVEATDAATDSVPFSDFVYRFFSALRSRSRLVYPTIAVFYFCALTVLYLVLHHFRVEMTFWQHLLVAIPLLFVGLFYLACPLGLVYYHHRHREKSTRHLCGLMNGLLERANQHKEKTKLYDSIDDACDELLVALRKDSKNVHIVSPNAVYFLADRFVADPRIGTGELHRRLAEIAKYTPDLQKALYTHRGTIHFIVPNPRHQRVRNYVRVRAERLGVDPEFLSAANLQALRWITGELSERRKGRRTFAYTTTRMPFCRALLTDHDCFIQRFPKYAAGILDPVSRITREKDEELFMDFTGSLEVLEAVLDGGPT